MQLKDLLPLAEIKEQLSFYEFLIQYFNVVWIAGELGITLEETHSLIMSNDTKEIAKKRTI